MRPEVQCSVHLEASAESRIPAAAAHAAPRWRCVLTAIQSMEADLLRLLHQCLLMLQKVGVKRSIGEPPECSYSFAECFHRLCVGLQRSARRVYDELRNNIV